MSSKVIAIDGPAASGKSTAAAGVARALGIPYVNTGSLYRAVALLAGNELDPVPERVLSRLQLAYLRNADGEFELAIDGRFPGAVLRRPEIAAGASRVATQPAVRAALLELQRKMAENGWLVMEGRDIGTVVFPDAAFKFFITASPEERARRRLAQAGETADGATLEEVAAEIRKRDEQDAGRAVAPLRPAPGAVLVDTTDLTAEAVKRRILNLVERSVCTTK